MFFFVSCFFSKFKDVLDNIFEHALDELSFTKGIIDRHFHSDTALEFAIRYGHRDYVQLLLEKRPALFHDYDWSNGLSMIFF